MCATYKSKLYTDTICYILSQWARELGTLSTPPVNIPLHSTELHYIITKPLEGMLIRWPGPGHFHACYSPIFTLYVTLET